MSAPVADGAVLVVGAAGTLGAATCREIAARGYQVWAADFADCAPLVDTLTGTGHRVATVDVTDEASTDQLVAAAWSEQQLSGVIYAAGTNYTGPVATTSWPDYDRVMNVNLRAHFISARRSRRACSTSRALCRRFSCHRWPGSWVRPVVRSIARPNLH